MVQALTGPKATSSSMAEETQLHPHRLLASAESESISVSETSLSGDEEASLLEDRQELSEEDKDDADIEKCDNTVSQLGKKTDGLQFFGWTIVNTLATIGIVSR